MAMTNRLAPSTPFDINSVFKKILEYVATDHNSILACRLITPTWNELALAILRENGTTVALWKAAPNLGKQAQIDTRANEVILVNQDQDLTLMLDTNPRGSAGQLESATRRLDLKLMGGTSEDPSDLLLQIPRAIQMGYSLNITSINYCNDPDRWRTGDRNFMLLLEFCASSLKTLTYIEGWSNVHGDVPIPTQEEKQRAADKNDERLVNFPKLATINIMAVLIQQRLNPLVMRVVNKSPNLRTFSLEDVGIGDEKGSSAVLMITNQMSIETRARIQELTIPAPSAVFIYQEFFTSIQLQNLQSLTLKLEVQLLGSSRQTEASFHRLLRALPLLRSLTCIWVCSRFYRRVEILPMFPALPQLAQFGTSGILNVYKRETLFVNRFLRMVGLQWGNIREFIFDQNSLYAISSQKIYGEWYSGILFSEVETLILNGYLNLCYDTDGSPESLVLKNCLNVHRTADDQVEVETLLPRVPKLMFPNLHKITIDNGSSFFTKQDLDLSEKYLLPYVLKIEGIRCLEIRTYYNHWLAKPRMDLSVLSNSLETLILRVPKDQDMMCEADPIKVQELSTLLGTTSATSDV